jgi:hypothetical protein
MNETLKWEKVHDEVIKMLYVCIIILTIALCYGPNAMLIMSTLVLFHDFARNASYRTLLPESYPPEP